MRAVVVTGPGEAEVAEVAAPVAAPGQVVVDVERVGVCGTDLKFYSGEMVYLRSGHARYPIRLGHEWCGTVAAVGAGVEAAWMGRRVTGDTMLGCGSCRRCRRGHQHVCEDRFEVGIRGGFPGALAEQLAVPATSLHALPGGMDPAAGALVEPGGNALRAVEAAALAPGDHLLVLGAGTIGLLVGLFARAGGAHVHLVDRSARALDFARGLRFSNGMGFASAGTAEQLPAHPFDAVVDATTAASFPAWAVEVVEPGGRVVCIGLAAGASLVDTRDLVLKDVTAVGVLSASPALAATVAAYAVGAVDPRLLVAATVSLHDVAAVLAGEVPAGAGTGPKVHVDPRAGDR